MRLTDHEHLLYAISITLFLTGAFLLFTGPIIDGDFFWHVKTGEWIWQNKELPREDPFSNHLFDDAVLQRSELVPIILRGYWLAQVLFFGVWKWLGPAGIIMLRAAAYTGIVAFIYFWTKKTGGVLAAFISAFLLANLLREFPGERPQLFSFILTPLVLFLLERARTKSAIAPPDLALPLAMLLWPNLHGGYILGVTLIVIYVLGSLFSAWQDRVRPPFPFLVLCLASLAVTGLNPNTYHVFPMLLRTDLAHTGSIQEFLSPLTAALQLGEYYFPYYGFFLGAAAVLAMRFRKMDHTHILVIIFLAGLSLTALRYMPYFLMAAPIVCRYVDPRTFRNQTAAVFLLLVLWGGTVEKSNLLKMSVDEGFPVRAAAFIHEHRPAGMMFNYYTWGGYFIQFLPEYPVFIDGRILNARSYEAYESILWQNGAQDTLPTLAINLIVMPAMSPVSGELFPLALRLFQDREWALVFHDTVSLVFVKQGPGSEELVRRHALRKELMFDQVLASATRMLQENPHNPGYWRALATAQYYKGDFAGAIRNYSEVLKRAPGDVRAREALQRLGPPPSP